MSAQKGVVKSRISNDLSCARVAAGVSHCLAIVEIMVESQKQDSYNSYQLVGWGSNENGCLGAKLVDNSDKENSDEDDDDNLERQRLTQMQKIYVSTFLRSTIQNLPKRILLKYQDVSYVPLQVACGSRHSIVVAVSAVEYKKLTKENKSLDKLLSSPKLSKMQVIFSAGVPLNGRLGRSGGDQLGNISLVMNEDLKIDEKNDDEDDDPDILVMTKIVLGLNNVEMVACGANFTIALANGGQVYSWGELGSADSNKTSTTDAFTPILVNFDNDLLIRFKFISAGTSHAAALSESGKLFTWGLGTYGQLGHKSDKSLNAPKEVGESLLGKKVDFVSCGGMHTCCVTSDGYAHSFGLNKNGQLGTGDYLSRNVPSKIQAISNYFVMYVKCGGNTTFVVTEEQMVFSFGCNMYGRLAQRDSHLPNMPVPTLIDPIFFNNEQEEFVYQLALSYHFGLALLRNGSIISWGLPYKGCLARDIEQQRRDLYQSSFEQQSQSNQRYEMQDSFEDEDDDLQDQDGNKITLQFEQMDSETLKQLTLPLTIRRTDFVKMDSENLLSKLQKETRQSQYISQIKCGTFHTVGLTDVGELWVWGSNQSKQHGLSDEDTIKQTQALQKITRFTAQILQPECMPTQVPFFKIIDNRRITYFDTGFEYIVVVENRRSVYSWGKNNCGQLGLGFVSEHVDTPTKLGSLDGMLIQQIACGEDHTLILSDEGFVYAFGSPADGKLGLGQKQTLQLQAQRVDKIQNVQKISCGPNHCLALATDPFQGERVIPLAYQPDDKQDENKEEESQEPKEKYVVYSWGSGLGGKLGHGNFDNYYYPKIIQTKYTFKQISCGTNHSGAISSDDNIIVWGVGHYLGLQRPDQDGETSGQQKTANTKKRQTEQELEPFYIRFPIIHVKLQNTLYIEICLGDKFNMALTKQKKITKWGLFNTDYQAELGKQMKTQTESNRQQVIENILLKAIDNIPGDITFTDLSCSFNHAAAMTTVGLDKETRRVAYSWGKDGMTGRLGLGYEFLDIEQKEDVKLDKKEGIVTQRVKKIDNLDDEFGIPQSLSFINQYLDNEYKLFLIGQVIKSADDDYQENKPAAVIVTDEKSVKPTKKDVLQLGNNMKKAAKPSSRVNLAQKLGIWRNSIKSMPLDQFLNETSPEIYNSAVVLTLFNEKIINDLYDNASTLEEENNKLYQQYKDVDLCEFQKFKDEAMLIILKKIQGKPFIVEFKGNEKKSLDLQFVENKFVYRVLLTLLQLHPCYLFNIHKNKLMDEMDYVAVVFDVFGDLQNDKRKYRIFTTLAMQILKHDLKKPKPTLQFDLKGKETVSVVFMHLFIGFQNQFEQNIKFNSKLQEFADKAIDGKIYTNESIPKALKDYAMGFTMEKMQTYLSQKSYDTQQIRKIFDGQVDLIQKLMTDFIVDVTKGFSQRLWTFPKPVQEMVSKVYEQLKSVYLAKNTSEETIQYRILNLCFLGYFQKFIQITRDKDSKFKDSDEQAEHRLLNVECHSQIFSAYLNQEYYVSQDAPWLIKVNEFIEQGDANRKSWFKSLVLSNKKQKDDVKKMKDLYFHSLNLKDDVINPRIKTLTLLTKIIINDIQKIISLNNSNDLLFIFLNQLNKTTNYNLQAPDNPMERIQLRLNSRQLFYAQKSYSIKKCQLCNCFMLEGFLAAEDKMFLERFEHWNPASLPSLFVQMASAFENKKEIEDFFSGIQPDIVETLKQKCIQWKNKNNYEKIMKIKDFERAFCERVKFFLEENDSIQEGTQQKMIFMENKKQLKELKLVVDEKLLDIYIYIYNTEQKMGVLDVINQLLKKKTTGTEKKKIFHEKIISNCFFGMANKEVEKALEQNTTAMTGKIRDAINDIPTSPEIYENIDVFKPNTNVLVKLTMFGNFSYAVLKNRSIIDRLEAKIFDDIRKIIKSPNLEQKMILDCLVYTFQEKNSNIQIYLLYQESKISVQSILSCGYIKPLKQPVELILDSFEIQNPLILSIRKNLILSQSEEPLKRKFGKYTHFTDQKLLGLLDELQNHYCIYDHMYQEPKLDQK